MLPSLATETAAGPLVVRTVVSNDSNVVQNAGTDTNVLSSPGVPDAVWKPGLYCGQSSSAH